MKWYYTESDEENIKHYGDSYEDVQFNILCIFRYKAHQNEVPDYYIWKDSELIEIMYGKDLYDMYVEHGGKVFEKYKPKTKQDEIDELSDTIHDVNEGLEELINNINKLTNMIRR